MTEIISVSATAKTSAERNIEKLLPLLSLLETPEGPDRIAQLMNLLRHILDAQNQHAQALKSVIEKLDHISRL